MLSGGIFNMINKRIHILILFTVLIMISNCSELTDPENPGSPYPNSLPETTIANVPLDNGPENPYIYRIKLFWDGGDEDGYIIGYKYRVDENDWIFTEETFVTIDFPSPDSINTHTFEVKSIDNDGGEDPTPASKLLYTKQTDLPETELLSGPPPDQSVFILKDTTDIWKGIEFSLGGKDADGEVVAYEYAIDDSTSWTKVEKSTIGIYGELADGEHEFFARAVDNAMGIDPTPVKQKFIVIMPTLEEKILIVDETRDGTGSAASPNDQMVDDFYKNILADFSFTEYDLKSEGAIDASTFAGYDIVVWHDEERVENLLKLYINEVESYLKIGGKFFISGWRAMENADNILSDNYIYSKNDFGYAFLQLESFKYQKEKDFIAAHGINGYPDLTTDPNKMLSSYEGKLNYGAVITPFDLSNQILAFDSFADNPDFEGESCAVKYFTNSYRVIALGFPLYVIDENQAKDFIVKAITDLRN